MSCAIVAEISSIAKKNEKKDAFKEEKAMRAYVDQEMCIGCGLCEGNCPGVFRMNDAGKAEACADTTDENHGAVMEAINGCPVSAIREEK